MTDSSPIFNAIGREALVPNDNFSRLAEDSLLKGTLNFTSDTYVLGAIEGAIIIKNSHENNLIFVAESAFIKGTITAPRIQISGRVEGDIEASVSVEIFHLGNVQGSISTPSLIIHTGAVFNGQSHVTKNTLLPRENAY